MLLLVLLASPNVVEARQGCCSRHSGVCGCECCDGTPLSSTCAPYYPECNQPITREIPSAYQPPKVEEQTTQSLTPSNNISILGTNVLILDEDGMLPRKDSSSNTGVVAATIAGVGLGGWGLYKLIKAIKK
jgi:hypothetical protein